VPSLNLSIGKAQFGSRQLLPVTDFHGWATFEVRRYPSHSGSKTCVLPPGFSASVTYLLSATNRRNWPTLTSVRPIQTPCVTRVGRGFSPSYDSRSVPGCAPPSMPVAHFFSSGELPIRNSPGGR